MQIKELQSSLTIRRELSQACDTRAFFSNVFVPLILL